MANEKRLRALAVGGLVEDNPLASGGTTLTSAGLAAMPVVGSTEHAAITLDPDGVFGAPEIAWITAHSAAAVSATVLRGQEGTTARQHDRDVPWVHGPTPRDFRLTSVRFLLSASGSSIQFGGTTWTEIAAGTNGPGTTQFDMSLPAEVGDVIEYAIGGLWDLGATSGRIDVATIVGGAVVNTFSTRSPLSATTYGVQHWTGQPGVYSSIAGSAWRTLVSGDLSSGTVTVRPYARSDSATVKSLVRGSDNPLFLCVKNLGPAGAI